MYYIKPDLEEIDLIIEGSFLQSSSISETPGNTETGGDGDEDAWG